MCGYSKTTTGLSNGDVRTFKHKAMFYLAVLLIFALGYWLRVDSRFSGASGAGYDEAHYSWYLDMLRSSNSFPEMTAEVLKYQEAKPDLQVLPSRTLSLCHGYLLSKFSSKSSFDLLNLVSLQASLSTLLLSGWLGRRMGGEAGSIALMAMTAVAPLQVFGAHRALTDGYFSFWVMLMMWPLWESLERPRSKLPAFWLALVWIPVFLCKESSFFVWLGTLLVLGFVGTSDGRRAHWRTWLAVCVGPTIGLIIQVTLFGGVDPFLRFLHFFRSKPVSDFTLVHCTGPWWAYLLAMLCLSQLTTLLAFAGALSGAGKERSGQFMLCLIVGFFGPLSAFPSLIVPRALAIIDFPLRWLCWLKLREISDGFAGARKQAAFLTLSTLLIVLLDYKLFVHYFATMKIYEPTIDVLLWSQDMASPRR